MLEMGGAPGLGWDVRGLLFLREAGASFPGFWGCRAWGSIAQAVGTSVEMGLTGARAGGVRDRAGCEGCGVSHLVAQTLGSEGEGVRQLARPGGTRHRASPTPPAPALPTCPRSRDVAGICQGVGSGVQRT